MPKPNIVPGDYLEWLDDKRIIFTANTQRGSRANSLYRWDIPDAVTMIATATRKICFDGKILYAIGTFGQTTLQRIRLTPPDFSSYTVLPSTDHDSQGTYFDDQQCLNRAIPTSLLDRSWVRLAPPDGYLDFGPIQFQSAPVRVAIVSDDGLDRRETDLLLNAPILPIVTKFLPKHAYFFHSLNFTPEEKTRWRSGGFINSWFISRDGFFESVKIPSGRWAFNDGTILIVPARSGFVIVAHGFSKTGEPGSAGAYYLRSQTESQQLVSGFVKNPKVSPNGCRLAFVSGESAELLFKTTKTSSRSLIVIDLCEERG
ncbi:MAG: hypothetical protein V5B60_13815 [Accumulibacter sp.]|uniref:hypothetical protein n=1 Tax=Accumulibacter sp. TaxID=2053492 RepID=UPI002FC373C3